MKTRHWLWCCACLFWLASTVSICSSAGNQLATTPESGGGKRAPATSGDDSGPPTGTAHWKVLIPSAGPQARGFPGPTIVYSPGTTNEVILFGGRDSAGNDYNDAWVLTNANGQNTNTGCPTTCWIPTVTNGATGGPSPSKRSGHSAVYDVTHDRMIIFGGCNSQNCESPLNDVWILSNASTSGPTWRQLSPASPLPGGRTKAVAAYDPNKNKLIIFGGKNGLSSGAVYSDTWVLSNANGLNGTPVWTQLNPIGTPAAGQYGATGTYDGTNNILTVFGGSTSSGTDTNGVWTLSNANGLGGTPAWNQLSISGSLPAARSFHTAVYNPNAGHTMTIFGGNTAVSEINDLNDLWVLSNANGMGGPSSWTEISGGGASDPSARNSHAAAYDTDDNIMMIFGGSGTNSDGWFVSPWVLPDASGQ
jgi:hypothetical protein